MPTLEERAARMREPAADEPVTGILRKGGRRKSDAAASGGGGRRDWAEGLFVGQERDGRAVTVFQVKLANSYTPSQEWVAAEAKEREQAQLAALEEEPTAGEAPARTTATRRLSQSHQAGGKMSRESNAHADEAKRAAEAETQAVQFAHLRCLSLSGNGLLFLRDFFCGVRRFALPISGTDLFRCVA